LNNTLMISPDAQSWLVTVGEKSSRSLTSFVPQKYYNELFQAGLVEGSAGNTKITPIGVREASRFSAAAQERKKEETRKSRKLMRGKNAS
jgi:hypothetical protein